MSEPGYKPAELLICSAARLMTDNTTVFVVTGIPMLAAALAQKMHAPNLMTIFEFGGTGAILDDLPIAGGGRRTFHRALAAAGICDVIEAAQRGCVEYGFLGGAQIDPYGNLNSTVIGDHDHPKGQNLLLSLFMEYLLLNLDSLPKWIRITSNFSNQI